MPLDSLTPKSFPPAWRRFLLLGLVAGLLLGASKDEALGSAPETDPAQPLPVRIEFDRGSFLLFARERNGRAVEEAARILEDGVPVILEDLQLEVALEYAVYLESDLGALRQAAGGALPEWGIGFAFPSRRSVVLGLAEAGRLPQDFREVMLHEASHVLLYEAVGGVSCPRWFVEGMAVRHAGQWGWGDSWEMAVAGASGGLPSTLQLEGGFPRERKRAELAYRVSYVAVETLFSEEPAADPAAFCREVRRRGNFEEAFTAYFGRGRVAFDAELTKVLKRRFGWTSLVLRPVFLFGFMTLLFLLAFLVKVTRARRRVKEWDAREDSY